MARLRMNITINIKLSANVLLLTMFTLFAYSCTKENEVTGARIYEGEKIPMSIKMGTRNTITDEDEVIKSVRAIVFNDKNELVYNDVSDASIIDGIYTASIRAARGYNNIYIICNETPELTEKLAAITLENEIEKVTFSAIGIVAPPPMYGNVARAYVESRSDGKNATVTINDIKMTELPVKVNRMVSRISFTAIKNIANEDEDFKVTKLNVKVCRMPVATPIGEGQAYTEDIWSDDLTIPGTGELDNNGTYTINGDNYTIQDGVDFITTPATYIPEHILSDPQNASHATYLKIDAQCVLKNGSTQVLNCIYLLNIGQNPPKNHNLTRNNHYQIYATITGMGAMGLYAEIVAMEEHDITINWKPIDGLVIVSDKAADYDAVADTSRNVNIWNDFSVYSGILKAYHSETGYKDVLFKYGSLIATGNDATATTEQEFTAPTAVETTNDVIWYPGDFNVTGIGNWDDVPYITDASNIPSGNTLELVAQGKGDPCRLAALSPHQIGAEGKVDNQQWHMANSTEYAILMKAANGAESKNDNGYRSFHELLIPNVKYRNESGVLVSSHNYNGNYWSTESNKAFSFDSRNPTAAALGAAAPGQGYTVRCVRNSIPEARITINPPTSVDYKGAAVNGLPFYIDSNVPYWKMELIQSGAHVGTSMNFEDFSFTPLAAGVMHEIEGSYTQTPKAYIARRASRNESRTFGVKFTSMHFTGEENTYYFTIKQNGYSISGKLSINNLEDNNRIKKEGGKYTIHIELTPDDVPMPVGAELKVRYTYLGTSRGEESTIATTINAIQREYDVVLNILPNDTPDVIGLVFHVYMNEKDGLGYREITSDSYYQNNE